MANFIVVKLHLVIWIFWWYLIQKKSLVLIPATVGVITGEISQNL